MSDLLICINAVLPIFIIICLGYFCRKIGMLEEKDVIRFNSIAFRVFLPVLIFYNIYQSDLSSAFRPKLIVFSAAMVLLTFFAAILFAKKHVRNAFQRSVVIQGLFRSNIAIIGIPLATALSQGGDISCVAVLSAVIVPLVNVLSVICLEAFGTQRSSPAAIAGGVARNPLIIGSALGILFLLLGIHLPAALEKVIKDLSGVASPLQLFLLGAFLKVSGLKNNRAVLFAVNAGKLLIIPAAAFLAGCLLGFRGIEMIALLTVFASSTAVNSFTMAQQMNGDAELAGEIVVTTSFFCSFTIFLWSFLLKRLGMI